MRKHIIAAALLLLVATPVAAADADDVMAPIHAFADGMSTGNMGMAMGAFTESPVMVDEFPPFAWSGAQAFATWGGDYGKDAAANGITDGKLVLGKVQRTTMAGDRAYVVTAADYSFKRKGVAEVEHAICTFVLDKTAAGWRIANWTFSY